jgi:hypothetical protein
MILTSALGRYKKKKLSFKQTLLVTARGKASKRKSDQFSRPPEAVPSLRVDISVAVPILLQLVAGLVNSHDSTTSLNRREKKN